MRIAVLIGTSSKQAGGSHTYSSLLLEGIASSETLRGEFNLPGWAQDCRFWIVFEFKRSFAVNFKILLAFKIYVSLRNPNACIYKKYKNLLLFIS